VGALIGVVILQVLTVARLVHSQAPTARCFERTVHRGKDACRGEAVDAVR
jgi:hypothetical protein